MNKLGKRILIGGGGAIVVIIALLVLPYLGRLTPAKLQIHISDKGWDRVTVFSPNIPEGLKTYSPPEEIAVSPIRHGPYRFLVEYEGGHKLWCHYFHTDVGARRKVDIFLNVLPEYGTIAVWTVANGDRIIYSNTVTASQTSEGKPVDIQ
jgi:hypothetical protein